MISAVSPCRSAVSLGTFYEHLCAVSLARALPSLQLRPRGGAGDGGVDLEGTFSSSPALAQCKCTSAGAGAGAVRALLAAVRARARAPALRAPPALGLLFSSAAFSRPAVHAAFAADAPLLLAHVSLAWEGLAPGGGEAGGAAPPPRARAAATVEALAGNRAFMAAFPDVSLQLPAHVPPDWLRMATLEGTPVLVRLQHASR